MRNQDASQKVHGTNGTSPDTAEGPRTESFADTVLSLLRHPAPTSVDPVGRILENGASGVRLATAQPFRGFLEWLLMRCLGELAPPLQTPAFLGESERRLILDTADVIGREVLGDSPEGRDGRVVVRLILDRCSGSPCAEQGAGPGAERNCPGPDGRPRPQGEIGHFCIGGPLRG